MKAESGDPCEGSPLLPGVPLDEEPVQHEGEHGHEAQIEPVVQLGGLSAALTHILEVGPLSAGTNLAGKAEAEIKKIVLHAIQCTYFW